MGSTPRQVDGLFIIIYLLIIHLEISSENSSLIIESSSYGDCNEGEAVTFSQLNLIDLAGPESSRTKTSGVRRKEGSYINKSLLTLGMVIAETLSEEEIAGLKEMFQTMGADNSGAITYDELKEGFRKYGSTLKDTEIRDLMNAAS
ncbi:Calcium-dependent protein kinase [Hordeum vulgare]|nr:Calcium-dependent protein kinase [Hordeum vulgare]